MNIRERLIRDRSKSQCLQLACELIEDQEKTQEFMDCLLGPDELLNQRAALLLNSITDVYVYPEILNGWEESLLVKLKQPASPDAITRAILRHWSLAGFTPEHEAEIYDLALVLLTGHSSVAIKAHAMYVCLQMVTRYPELCPEFQYVIMDVMARYSSESAAITSRGKKVLAKLKAISVETLRP